MEDIRHWAVEWNVSEEQTAVATVEALRARAAAGGQVCVPSRGGLPRQRLNGFLCLRYISTSFTRETRPPREVHRTASLPPPLSWLSGMPVSISLL